MNKLKTGREWALQFFVTSTVSQVNDHFTHREIQFSSDGIAFWHPFPSTNYEKPISVRLVSREDSKTMLNWLIEEGYSTSLAKRYLEEGRVSITYDKTKKFWMKVTKKNKILWGRPIDIKVDLSAEGVAKDNSWSLDQRKTGSDIHIPEKHGPTGKQIWQIPVI